MTGWSVLAGSSGAVAVWLGPRVDGARRLGRLQRAGSTVPSGRRAVGLGATLVRAGRSLRAGGHPATGEHVVELLAAFAAELRAGAAPSAALERCTHEVTDPVLAADLAPVVEMMRLGAAGPAALRHGAGGRCPELGWLAAGWELADAHGTPLAPAATWIAVAAREQLRHRSAIRAELAGARVSARMLAALPAVGLGLGAALGADPLHVLLATPLGSMCLVGALLLEYAGLRWTSALVRRATVVR